jgi:hypothetical protein
VKPDFVRPKNVVTIRSLGDAFKLLDEWQEAYADLRRDYHKMHERYIDALFWREVEESNAKNYETLFRAYIDPANEDIRDTLSLILRQT